MSKEDMSWIVERAEDIQRICTESFEAGRAKAMEEAAVAAWTAGMEEHSRAKGLPVDAREVGSRAAKKIRALGEPRVYTDPSTGAIEEH